MDDKSGVIWITGFSSSGKTTVGRKVEKALRKNDVNTIFLDGDDLRSIFAERWGFERSERVELARVYFRLCSHLASQGYCVVISAIAMYSEVREWLRENVPGVYEVYLKVPIEERKSRDKNTKKIYEKLGDISKMYDVPDGRVFTIENYGNQTSDATAKVIVDRYLSQKNQDVDFGRQGHWSSYYSSGAAPSEASQFAVAVNEKIKSGSKLLEIGCGNGRDASFFAHEGHTVVALDPSAGAIDVCRENDKSGVIDYRHGNLPGILKTFHGNFDVIYSRFVIHAMPLVEEIRTIDAAAKVTSLGGMIFIECRSINDQLAREGEVISPTERIAGHYRRFIVKEELESRLAAAGFKIIDSVESKGLAVFGDNDPMIIRVRAERV